MPDPAPESVDRWMTRLSERLTRHRLNRNLTQEELAKAAGISRRTLARLEAGEPTQLESFLRVIIALGLEGGLDRTVPDVPQSPIQQLQRAGRTRRRASGRRLASDAKTARPDHAWTWGDEG